jgi:predicted transport protein
MYLMFGLFGFMRQSSCAARTGLCKGSETVNSEDAALQTMIKNLAEKTGRTLPDWVTLARATGLSKHKALVDTLKAEHGLGHGYANLVAMTALKAADAPEGEDLVEVQYAGAKAGLLPLYDKLTKAISGFGGDVELAPKKAYVSLRRNKQFGLIQASTATRLDLGLNLKGVEAAGRLEAAGSFNAMCTHRVKLASIKDIDAEVIGWLRQAYAAA